MSDTIICPDCGQSYDPAIERGEFRSARGVKSKPRVGAQDVRTPGHRSGPHHAALVGAYYWRTAYDRNGRAFSAAK